VKEPEMKQGIHFIARGKESKLADNLGPPDG
jgi:hypothetical protein